MKNKQNIYLDKVIEYLLRDTKIDYKNEKITTPFPLSSFSLLLPPFLSSFVFFFPLLSFPILPVSFSSYSKVTYGLTEQEIEYVWKEYKSIIKIKIENGR